MKVKKKIKKKIHANRPKLKIFNFNDFMIKKLKMFLGYSEAREIHKTQFTSQIFLFSFLFVSKINLHFYVNINYYQ